MANLDQQPQWEDSYEKRERLQRELSELYQRMSSIYTATRQDIDVQQESLDKFNVAITELGNLKIPQSIYESYKRQEEYLSRMKEITNALKNTKTTQEVQELYRQHTELDQLFKTEGITWEKEFENYTTKKNQLRAEIDSLQEELQGRWGDIGGQQGTLDYLKENITRIKNELDTLDNESYE